MIEVFAMTVVVAFGLYLLALGGASFVAPRKAASFLGGFAGTASKHFLEMGLRLVVGAALVLQAPRMAFSVAFNLLGWAMLATTAVLLLIPWRWHQKVAEHVLPRAMRHLWLMGMCSLAFGALILVAIVRGDSAG